ncbi:MAG: 5-oxoprolinase subunit PxpB [Lysobacteraceae bacterium]
MNAGPVEPLGEAAWLLRWPGPVGLETNRRVHALARRLQADAPQWLDGLVPAYASLAVLVRPEALDRFDAIGEALAALLEEDAGTDDVVPGEPLVLPVCYDPDFAPDLDAVCHRLELRRDQFIAAHAAAGYEVAMIGFAPGFTYLLGLPESLAVPRLETPRTRLEAGSVGIGGNQTGVYPAPGPGGWRLVGRTPLRLFMPGHRQPCRFRAGDRVRIEPVDRARFEDIARAPGGIAHD